MKIILKQKFPVSAQTLYKSWLSGEEHSKMTQSEAQITDKPGESFSTWDGYIVGENVRLIPDRQIVQSWRSGDFQEQDPDSMVTINLEDMEGGCLLTLIHENIPNEQPDYEEGWREYYFKPMMEYFSK